MNTNHIIPSLVSCIQGYENEIFAAPGKAAKKAVLLKKCEPAINNMDHHTAQNVRNIIDYLSEHIGVAGLLQLMDNSVNNVYDRQTRKREAEDNFDAIYGTCTCEIKEQFELNETITPDRFLNLTRYVPSPIQSVKTALDQLPKHGVVYEDSVFIDIGSGMGRNLLLASEYPFKWIAGVEISAYLNQFAKTNLTKFNSPAQKCKDIRLHCMNALDFILPESHMVLYFWSPFEDLVADPFMEKLEAFSKRNAFRIHLVFLESPFTALNTSTVFKKIDRIETPVLTGKDTERFVVNLFSN